MLAIMGIHQITAAQTYNISGSVTGFKSNSKVFLRDIESETHIAGTVIQNGKFQLHGKLKDGQKYVDIVIYEAKENYICTVFAGEGKVFITADKKDFPYNVTVTGGTEQAKYNNLQQLIKPLTIATDKAYLALMRSSYFLPNHKQYDNIANQRRDSIKKWVFDNLTTFYAADGLYQYLQELNHDTIQRYYNSFPPQVKQSIYGRRINAYLSVGDTLKINDHYADFEAFDKQNKPHKLSGITGKYILLDFSTLFCGPCRESIDELKRQANKYRDKLTLVTFSPDKQADWLQGIKDDNINWLSLSDGQGRYSKTLMKYAVQAYPTFYLISPDGVIVDKWLGYDKTHDGDIEKHLSKVLNP